MEDAAPAPGRSPSPPGDAGDAASASSQLQFTVLYGSHSSSQPPCYLLEVSGCKILLDCGWDSSYEPALLEPLERVASEVALVLVSHADVEHMGALPYAVKHFKLAAPVYMTSPVLKLGHLCCYDAVLSSAAPYTLDDVDRMMAQTHELKYQQPLELKLGENKENVVVRALAAGRTLGGAVWHIFQEPSLNVLYATDIYQKEEAFLDGLDMKMLTKSPTLLVQDVLGVHASRVAASLAASPALSAPGLPPPAPPPRPAGGAPPPPPSHRERDGRLLDTVLHTLRAGGDVLIPVDATARALNVLLLLDERWQREKLDKSFELVFFTRISSVFDVASSHLEWCSKKLQAALDAAVNATRDSREAAHGGPGPARDPFRVAKVVIADTLESVFASARPHVVVCSGAELARATPSRDVFVRRVAQNPLSCVLNVLPPLSPDSVASQLLGGARLVSMEEEQWVPLEGEELAKWQEERQARLADLERERQEEADFDEPDDDPERGVAAVAAAAAAAAQAPGLVRAPSVGGVVRSASGGVGGATVAGGSAGLGSGGAGAASAREAGGGGAGAGASAPGMAGAAASALAAAAAGAGGGAAGGVPGAGAQAAGSAGEDAAVFPFHAEQWRADEYGGFVDEEALMDEEARRALREERARRLAEASGAAGVGAGEGGGASAEGPGAPAPTPPEPHLEARSDAETDLENAEPRKKVKVTLTLPVRCGVYFVDYSGRPSGTDLYEIVNLVKPKKLVVVRADLRDSEWFASDCQTRAACAVGLAPSPGECIDVAADSSVLRIRVPEEALAAFPPAVVVGDFVVQRVRGRMALLSLAPSQQQQQQLLQQQQQQQAQTTQQQLQDQASSKRRRVVVAGGELPSILPPSDAMAAFAGDGECWWTSKGEPPLVKVLERLKQAGVQAKFHDTERAVLVCGVHESVCVWKPPGGGRLMVSGPLGADYFAARRAVYDCFGCV